MHTATRSWALLWKGTDVLACPIVDTSYFWERVFIDAKNATTFNWFDLSVFGEPVQPEDIHCDLCSLLLARMQSNGIIEIKRKGLHIYTRPPVMIDCPVCKNRTLIRPTIVDQRTTHA